MAASSSITISKTMAWAAKLNFGRNAAPTGTSEPALTSANTVLQTILSPPFAWRWNRQVTGFVTTPGQQDYTLVNWSAAATLQPGWLTVDDAGNSQKVAGTSGPTGATAPTWNHNKGQATVDGGVTWTNLGPIGVPVNATYNFGWIETVSVADVSAFPYKWKEIEAQLCMGSDASLGRPAYIAAQGDDGGGNITFRLTPCPDVAYAVAITLQAKPTLFTTTLQTWAPIPDEFSHIYNWGFLSLMWLFADDPRFAVANQKFIAQILGTSEGLTETERNIFLQNWEAVTGQPMSNATAKSQGFQARSV